MILSLIFYSIVVIIFAIVFTFFGNTDAVNVKIIFCSLENNQDRISPFPVLMILEFGISVFLILFTSSKHHIQNGIETEAGTKNRVSIIGIKMMILSFLFLNFPSKFHLSCFIFLYNNMMGVRSLSIIHDDMIQKLCHIHALRDLALYLFIYFLNV